MNRTYKDKSPCKIWVIEDHEGDFFLLKDYLEDVYVSPEIERFYTYREFVVHIRNNPSPADIILLDLSLPDKSGQELVENVLINSQNIPIIILTGYTDLELARNFISLGIYDYLIKDQLNKTC